MARKFNGLNMVDFFISMGQTGIKSWAIYKNAILFDLFNSNSSNTINYLPPIVNKGDPLFPYLGLHHQSIWYASA
jgi:hypothetical protein